MRLLNDRSVEYLLVGGYAVGFYGYPRATGDLDVWVAVSDGNAEKVVAALRDFGFDSPGLTPEAFANPRRIVRMGMPPLRIEVITSISGVDFADSYPRRVTARIDGVDVPVIGLEDLKCNKRAAGRPKDCDDVDNLETR